MTERGGLAAEGRTSLVSGSWRQRDPASLGRLRWCWLGQVPYAEAWELQRRLAAARATGAVDDTLLLLEHPPVYTVGRQGRSEHLLDPPEELCRRGAEVFDVDRGGSVTFHGPGQLVAYPIVGLAEVFPLPGRPDRGDLGRYLRALEEAVVRVVAEVGVIAGRRPPYTGVWVGNDKLAAVGVKLSSGVTMHGLALNVTTDLRWFAAIVPCGIRDGGVTSVAALGVGEVACTDLAPRLAYHLAEQLGRRGDAVETAEVVAVETAAGSSA